MNKLKECCSFIILLSIFILSIIKINSSNLPEESDKVVHFIMYIFAAMSFYNLKFKYFVVFSIVYGVIIEIIQYFIPWRSFSLGDIFANILGALSFLILLNIYKKNKI